MKQKITLLTRLMLLLCALIVGSGSVWADTDFEFNLNALYQNGTLVTAKTVITESGGTLTFTDQNENFTILLTRNSGNQPGFYTSSGYFRFYSSDTFKLTAAEGITITKVVITPNGSSFSLSSQDGLNTSTKTWTGSASEVTFTGAGTNKWDKLTITYTTSGGGDTPDLEDCDLALTGAPIELEFDLYDNADAQVINYTTSSTGEVSVEAGMYDVSCYVDEDAKTITVTPFAVTNGAQTITVNQAADDTYKAGSVTFTVTVTDNTPQTGAWVLTDLADLAEGDVFVIVGDNGDTYAMSNGVSTSNPPSAVAVTIENDEITGNVADNIKWNISVSDDGYTFYPDGDTENWLYCTNSNNGVRVGTGDAKHFTLTTGSNAGYLTTTETTKQRYIGIYNSQDWRCYDNINANIQGQTFAFYKYVDNTGVQNPSISASSVSIAYDATSGEIAYSIVNPVDGTTLTAATEAEWISDITVAEDKVTFTTTANEGAERTATITLTYGTVTKDVTVTQAAAPVIYTTIPDLFAAATSTATDVNVTFNNWVVSGVSTNGKNVFVTDGTNGFVIFDSNGGLNNTYAVGNILSGTAVSCKLQLFNGFVEITELDATDLTITAGGTVSAANIAMADLAGVNTGALVSYENLTCSVDNNKYYLSDGTTTLQVYNSLFAFEALEDGKTYNITGIYQQYNTTKEILPRSAEDIEEVVNLEPSITVSTNTIEVSVEGTDGTITVTYDNITDVMADVYFCDADGAEATYDWIVAEINAENNLDYFIFDNDGDARTAYMKVYALDDEGNDVYSELITITQAAYVAPANGYFEKVTNTDDITNGQYLIVYEGNATHDAVAFDGSLETLDAASNTINVIFEEDGTIKATSENKAAVFNIDVTNGTLKSAYGYYIGVLGNSNGLKTSTDATTYANSFSIDENGNAEISAVFDGSVMTLRYNYASDNLRFRYYKNYGQQPIQLYKFIPGTVDVTSFGWATYIAEDNVSFGNDVSAYIATGNSDTSVTLTEVQTVVKGTPVVVCAEEGTHKLGAVEASYCDDVSANLLVVCDGSDLESGYNYFVLAKNGESDACFKQWMGEASDLTGRVVLPLELDLTQGGTRALKINFGGEATGIATIDHSPLTIDDAVYNLNGQRVSQLKKGGLYIMNGKKVFKN